MMTSEMRLRMLYRLRPQRNSKSEQQGLLLDLGGRGTDLGGTGILACADYHATFLCELCRFYRHACIRYASRLPVFAPFMFPLPGSDGRMPKSEHLEPPLPEIVGAAAAMQEVYRLVRLAAPRPTTVLLIGETGTGKEIIAKAIHKLSRRASGPFVRVNCGALHENLLESELFGHIKGSFTGAVADKVGRFEAAHGGTIFLDEINSTSPQLQLKLLRVLQERELERVGDTRTVRVDVRVIAATNASLEELVEEGQFREDLYFRLNVIPFVLPPLRERRDDIAALAHFFLHRYGEVHKCPVPELSPAVLDALMAHDWPGNVRELENAVERLVVLADGGSIGPEMLRFGRPRYALRSAKGSKAG